MCPMTNYANKGTLAVQLVSPKLSKSCQSRIGGMESVVVGRTGGDISIEGVIDRKFGCTVVSGRIVNLSPCSRCGGIANKVKLCT